MYAVVVVAVVAFADVVLVAVACVCLVWLDVYISCAHYVPRRLALHCVVVGVQPTLIAIISKHVVAHQPIHPTSSVYKSYSGHRIVYPIKLRARYTHTTYPFVHHVGLPHMLIARTHELP